MDREAEIEDIVIAIASTESVVEARQRGRDLASQMGFTQSEATMIAAAISELARNIVQYASNGEIRLRRDASGMLYVIARDEGPGISDVRNALKPGYSTSGSLGLGLAGVQRIADHFEIQSTSKGTTVTLGKKRL
jgi:serine/threonine-protein kinase RsbT